MLIAKPTDWPALREQLQAVWPTAPRDKLNLATAIDYIDKAIGTWEMYIYLSLRSQPEHTRKKRQKLAQEYCAYINELAAQASKIAMWAQLSR